MPTITGTNKADIINTFYVSPGVQGGPAVAGPDTIRGHNGDDEIRAGGGADQVFGDNGDDRLWGDAGADQLDGGNGDDTLDGGADADRLFGGKGDDLLVGGSSADVFVVSKGDDRIADFSPAMAGTKAVTIDFDDFSQSPATLPNGYEGLNWSGFQAVDGLVTPQLSGFRQVINSSHYVGYDSGGGGASFSSPDGDFDLKSGYFAAAWRNDLILTAKAYDEGLEVGTATIVLNPAKTFVDFAAGTAVGAVSAVFSGRFTSIDKVHLDGSGGTPAPIPGPGSIPGQGEQFAVDDISLVLPTTTGDGDKIAVATGTDIAALVASAHDDGQGNTVLQTGGGSLTLEGVAPSLLSENWFVAA